MWKWLNQNTGNARFTVNEQSQIDSYLNTLYQKLTTLVHAFRHLKERTI